MGRGRFSLRHGGLCIAVAVLMPAPAATAGQPLAETPVVAPSWSSAAAQALAVPVVPVSTDRPPVVTAAPTGLRHQDGKHHWRDHRKKRAVIKTTEHERIEQISANTSYDVPLAALTAYRTAADKTAASYPGCHLSWGVIAAIGQVESGHGRFGGAAVLSNGVTTPRIVGPELNGRGPVAAIHDTDNGVYDGDKVWDRAVGPMQFIPTTWVNVGVDGDHDGHRNPSDFDDAALSTAIYLCGAGGDFSSLGQARANVMRYNHSEEYVDLVLRIANAYDSGVVDVVPNDVAPPRQPAHKRHHSDHPGRNRHHDKPAHQPRHPADKPHHPSQPGQQPDHPSRPKPHHPSQPKPDPKPEPKPDPPKPKPDPKPEPPVIKHYKGTWEYAAGTKGTVRGSTTKTFTIPAALVGDANHDGTAEDAGVELEAIDSGTVTVTTTDGVVTGFVVNKQPPPPSTPSPTPTSPATSAPSAGVPTTAELSAAPTPATATETTTL